MKDEGSCLFMYQRCCTADEEVATTTTVMTSLFHFWGAGHLSYQPAKCRTRLPECP